MREIVQVELVSDGMMVSFRNGDIFYVEAETLHRHLDLAACCRFLREDPCPVGLEISANPESLINRLMDHYPAPRS